MVDSLTFAVAKFKVKYTVSNRNIGFKCVISLRTSGKREDDRNSVLCLLQRFQTPISTVLCNFQELLITCVLERDIGDIDVKIRTAFIVVAGVMSS